MDELLKAEQQLKRQLQEAGLDLAATYLNMVWHAFRMFVTTPSASQGDMDGVMIEKSTFRLEGDRLHQIKFIRHMAISDDQGELVCTEHLNMRLRTSGETVRRSTSTFYPADVDGFTTVARLGAWDAEFSRVFE